eukprot:5917200-Pyramimonas_sp.AAC.1
MLPFAVAASPIAPPPPPGLSRSVRARLSRAQLIEERARDTAECLNLLGGYATPRVAPERLSHLDDLLHRR